MKKLGTFYGIGVGPGGDEELLTLKAVKAIENSSVIIAPAARKGGDSIALDTAKNFIKEGSEVKVLHFPMERGKWEDKVYNNFKLIEEKLLEGKNVAFLTIGDPLLYSTFIYILNHINEEGYETKVIPGINSFCAAASLSQTPLVLGDEGLLILPASKIDELRDEKFVIIMKLGGKEEEVLNVLDEKGYKYVYVSKAYREGEQILRHREEIIKNGNYMSLIIAEKEVN
jgi:precorrin-2/cobalt-factor-2 C20-methyltransferase